MPQAQIVDVSGRNALDLTHGTDVRGDLIGGPRSGPIEGVIVHHSAGGTIDQLINSANQTGIGAQYYIDQDGTIYQFAPATSVMQQISTSENRNSSRPDLTNQNTVGIEIMARSDRDVTQAQIAAARSLTGQLAQTYNFPLTNVFGHGELQTNKQSDEGLTIASAIRGGGSSSAGNSGYSQSVAQQQQALQAQGYNLGPSGVDGIMGRYTQAALDASRGSGATPNVSGPPSNQYLAYLAETATPGGTMSRQGTETALSRLEPGFASNLSAAIAQARAEGIPAGVYSAYRAPEWGVGGYSDKSNSLHSYGLATDITGIGRPGSDTAARWYEIAQSHGIYNPYGPNNTSEWNHYQAVPEKGRQYVEAHPEMRNALSRSPTDRAGMETMWRAAGFTSAPYRTGAQQAAQGMATGSRIPSAGPPSWGKAYLDQMSGKPSWFTNYMAALNPKPAQPTQTARGGLLSQGMHALTGALGYAQGAMAGENTVPGSTLPTWASALGLGNTTMHQAAPANSRSGGPNYSYATGTSTPGVGLLGSYGGGSPVTGYQTNGGNTYAWNTGAAPANSGYGGYSQQEYGQANNTPYSGPPSVSLGSIFSSIFGGK